MGVAPSGTSLVRRVHFQADAHTRGLYFDPSNGVRECVMEASHPHTQDLYGMERKQQRRVCESSGG